MLHRAGVSYSIVLILVGVLLPQKSAQYSTGQSPSELPTGGQIKAVLVAGSNGYGNYRHQADICHAYQILRKNGIPEENIIVMMYDDIANNTDNPKPGVIINRPNGPNVYHGIKIDYRGEDVNKQNFFNVLLGNKHKLQGIGSGRVLESGPNDNVFVNFADHGGPGVLIMPSEEIMSSEFLEVLEKMHTNSRFAKMFLYIEACESGSMFDDLLPDNLNIFVMTAADPHESSYACYFDETVGAYLGDVFSVEWMQDAETVDLRKEEVNHQFEKVRTETNTSHVEEYGDIDIGVTKLSEVMGYNDSPSASYSLNITDAVPSRHVPVATLARKIHTAKTQNEERLLKDKLHKLLEGRDLIDKLFFKLLNSIKPHLYEWVPYDDVVLKRPALTKRNVACFEESLNTLIKDCFSISENPFVTSHLHKLINLCDSVAENTLASKISSVCKGAPRLRGIS